MISELTYSRTGWLILLALLTVIFLPVLLTEGMFFDGVTYATIARNMSEGTGSFWKPFYTTTVYPEFYEHPPLALGIQALFFKLVGDHFYTERLFSLVCLIISMLSVYKLYTTICKNAYHWIPLLCLLTIPVYSWSYLNNLLENVLTIFTTLSVLFFVIGIQKNQYYAIVLGSMLSVAAFLIKGPVGLFPIITILVYYLAYKKKTKWLIHFSALLLAWSMFFSL